jgi:hypothetical protein
VGILASLWNCKTCEFTQTQKNQNCGIEQISELSSLRNFYSNAEYWKNKKGIIKRKKQITLGNNLYKILLYLA